MMTSTRKKIRSIAIAGSFTTPRNLMAFVNAAVSPWTPMSELLTLVPIPMLLWCPECGDRHLDVGEFATKVHHTHACQSCGMVWRPCVLPTVGVQWLPGFKNG